MTGISGAEMIVSACIFGIIPLATMGFGFLVHREKSKERLLAIEKGTRTAPAADDRNFRVGGMICLAVSIGLLITLASLDVPRGVLGVLGVPAIPGLVGIALLFEYRARMREKNS